MLARDFTSLLIVERNRAQVASAAKLFVRDLPQGIEVHASDGDAPRLRDVRRELVGLNVIAFGENDQGFTGAGSPNTMLEIGSETLRVNAEFENISQNTSRQFPDSRFGAFVIPFETQFSIDDDPAAPGDA
jgi:hypothetical protein